MFLFIVFFFTVGCKQRAKYFDLSCLMVFLKIIYDVILLCRGPG